MIWLHTHSPETLRLLKRVPDEQVISFAGGLPAQECIPTTDLDAALKSLPRECREQNYQYSWPEGVKSLQEQIAQRMTDRSMPTSDEEILITHGAQQALDILAKYFALQKWSGVIESPTYFPAIETYEVNRVKFKTVRRNEEGLDFNALRQHLSAAKSWMYVIPTGHNPTGLSLNLEQRQELLALSAENGALLIEDDVYGELQYDAQELSLRTLSKAGIYIGSFSKILAPGLRVGWIAAEPELIEQLLPIKHACDLQTNSMGQAVLSAYLERCDLGEQVSRCRKIYRERRDALLAALKKYFPPAARWTLPAAGFSLWVNAPHEGSPDNLLEAALDRGVAFEPGRPFIDKAPADGVVFRLSFSMEPPERIAQGIEILGGLLTSRRVCASL